MTVTAPSNKTNRIRSVTIEGFRSLKNIQNLELPPLTVLIGANGAGKSTLIRFFEMLSWMLKAKNLQEFVLRHGGPPRRKVTGGPRLRAAEHPPGFALRGMMDKSCGLTHNPLAATRV